MKVIIGAQVGETSLLTRAGMTLAHAAKTSLLAQEGAFGLHLLEFDICNPCLMFSKSGLLTLPHKALKNNTGFGLNINIPMQG